MAASRSALLVPSASARDGVCQSGRTASPFRYAWATAPALTSSRLRCSQAARGRSVSPGVVGTGTGPFPVPGQPAAGFPPDPGRWVGQVSSRRPPGDRAPVPSQASVRPGGGSRAVSTRAAMRPRLMPFRYIRTHSAFCALPPFFSVTAPSCHPPQLPGWERTTGNTDG
jgi:hypothetical protein